MTILALHSSRIHEFLLNIAIREGDEHAPYTTLKMESSTSSKMSAPFTDHHDVKFRKI
jgi:hypothetical protein